MTDVGHTGEAVAAKYYQQRGWLLLNQSLSLRESAGCALIFAAVVLSQLPLEELRGCKKSV